MTMDKMKWAEGLIAQLPETHDGRNSWLMNHGTSAEAIAIRQRDGRPNLGRAPELPPMPPAVELGRLLNVIEAPTADASAKIAAAERLAEIVRAQALILDTPAARKVLSARELRNRWYDAGKTDEAAELDEALGDTPASPVAANEQKILGQKLADAISRITQLEAAAMIVAEIERLERAKS